MHKRDWLKMAAGGAMIAFSLGNSPIIPDEPILIPLGLALIADGLK